MRENCSRGSFHINWQKICFDAAGGESEAGFPWMNELILIWGGCVGWDVKMLSVELEFSEIREELLNVKLWK